MELGTIVSWEKKEGDQVSEGDLLDGLVLGALGLLLVEVLLDVLGVDERDDAVEPRKGLDGLVHKKGLRDGRGVGHARRLDDDAVEAGRARGDPLGEREEHRDQVLAQRDAVVFGEEEGPAKPVAPAPSPSAAVANGESTEVLIEIRDSLRRMEAMMKDRQNEGS